MMEICKYKVQQRHNMDKEKVMTTGMDVTEPPVTSQLIAAKQETRGKSELIYINKEIILRQNTAQQSFIITRGSSRNQYL